MKNWEALDQPDKAEKSKKWAIGSIAYFVVVMLSGLIAPDSRAIDGVSKLLGLVLLITWYYSIGKSQQYFVLAKLDGAYQHRGWLKPILTALGIFIAVIVTGAILAVLSGAAGAA